MKEKMLVEKLDFTLKEGENGVFIKTYKNNYRIEVDFEAKTIHFGGKIKIGERVVQNMTKPEDWVVLECVNRLLEKGYEPQDIVLEKVYPTGHQTSGRLDMLVCKEGKAFLMIECKTWGKEFDKACKKIQKDGGQLFTYFQQDTHADFLMLYTSAFENGELSYKNEIIKIEDHYRTAGNVADFFDRWNKLTEQNGIFESWVKPYDFKTKALVKAQLKPLTEEDSSFIFHEFLSILRKHSVSDKPNAFNKIFNLFLSKIYDEKKRDDEELDFQWKEKEDNDVRFQIRLINLYQEGMLEFLRKEVEGIRDSDFSYKTPEELEERKKKWLKFNNVFTIKEVIDDETFEENARVLKEVVELLQKYQVRYPRKQQHLSDFFERLLTTGLKQESGQFFTPPPIARFIIRSLPIKRVIDEKLKVGNTRELLPAMIDYAAGSGHFLTESMEEMQNIIDQKDPQGLYPEVENQLKVWQLKKYDWAAKYIYGIEKDYRLVKVAKVGCYFYGDGLAQVIHGDGLDNFEASKNYIGLLKDNEKKPQFDFVISNPPYSVSTFRGDMKSKKPQNDFELYHYLSDRSSEIECLFIERTKQLLREGGIAAVILPSSILSNTGIYTKAREILLKHFEFVAITELGSNTFMATGTNTVVLFLRRRNDEAVEKIKNYVTDFTRSPKDMTVNGVEKVFSKYVAQVWEGLNFEDYASLIQGRPNATVQAHELYGEYQKKIKAKNEAEKLNSIMDIEAEKLLYFILAYPQELVLVKTGEKNVEKNFLGYEFSNRRGYEGIHPIQRGKSIDECTQLFDPEISDNPTKASTYILDAFEGRKQREIDPSLKSHVLRANLVDMMTWDRVEFEKNVGLNVKKKSRIESQWEMVRLGDKATIKGGNGFEREFQGNHLSSDVPFYKVSDMNKSENRFIMGISSNYVAEDILTKKIKAHIFPKNTIIFPKVGKAIDTNKKRILGRAAAIDNNVMGITVLNEKLLSSKYLFEYFSKNITLSDIASGSNPPSINASSVAEIKIPLPPLDIQQKIVDEIEVLEEKERKAKEEIEKLKKNIKTQANQLFSKYSLQKLGSLCENPMYGANERAVPANPKTDYRYIRITDINEDGSLNNDWKTAEKVEERYILKDGDFLFARSGATAGKTFLYKEKCGKALYAGYLIKFPVKKKVLNSSFLNFILKGDVYLSWVLGMRGGTAQPNINAQQYSSFEIPLPPLSEQQKIVAEIEKIEAQIESLEKELAQIPAQKEAVLKKYL